MNLKKLYQLVCKEWSNLTFEIDKETRSEISFSAELSVDGYDDDISFIVDATDEGDLTITCLFDKLQPTLANYELVNEFNSMTNFYKAYIMKGNNGAFFSLEYNFIAFIKQSEKELLELVSAGLRSLTMDSTKKYLQPIAQLTQQ